MFTTFFKGLTSAANRGKERVQSTLYFLIITTNNQLLLLNSLYKVITLFFFDISSLTLSIIDIYRQVQTATADTPSALEKLRNQLRYYAVVDIAGRPFLVTKNDKVIVNRLNDVKVGDVLKLDKVREIGSKDYTLKGTPYVPENVFDIKATVIEHTKSKLIRIVKKKRRKNYKRTIEHKQTHTVLRISDVDVL